MHASRTRTMLPVVVSLCAVALLLSPASSADPESLGTAVGGGDSSWRAEAPAEAPAGVAATLKWTEDDVADGIGVPLPAAGRQALRPRRHTPSALSPDARRGLDHEARCGPRVSVGRGVFFPWPGRDPRCRGGATLGGDAAGAPAVHRLLPLVDER